MSPFHLMIILAVIVLFFGGRKIPDVMRGVGEGIGNFKEGMNPSHSAAPAANLPASPPATAPVVNEEKK